MILLTGGAGFLGAHMGAALVAMGADLAVVDSADHPGKERNLQSTSYTDLIAPADVAQYLQSAPELSAVVHMGAITSTTEQDASLFRRVNYDLSFYLWNWCAENAVPFLYASSAATYGDGEYGFFDHQDPKYLSGLKPLNPYGRSKHLFDRKVCAIAARGKLTPPRWAGLKFFNVFGPGEGHKGEMKSVVAKAFDTVAAGESLRLFRSHREGVADGEQKRDFIYVKDCADVALWWLQASAPSGLYNVGTGSARSFLDLARGVFGAVGRDPAIEFIDTPPKIRDTYQYFTEANVERLRRAGYDRPFTRLESGITDYAKSFDVL